MYKIKDMMIDEHERHEAMKGLVLWSAINTVAEAVSHEVTETGNSVTLNALYDKIKEIHEGHTQ